MLATQFPRQSKNAHAESGQVCQAIGPIRTSLRDRRRLWPFESWHPHWKISTALRFRGNNVPGYVTSSRLPDQDMGLPLDQATIGDHMKTLGYRTAIIGKWHQGNADRFHPLRRGFDEFYGFRGGARSYFAINETDKKFRLEDRVESAFGDFVESPKYLTDVFADETISFIERNQGNPFFVMLSFTAVHTPMQAERKDVKAFPSLTGKRQRLAAMTLSMDRACGRVLDKLPELELYENTIVVFTNDNGGPSDSNSSDNSP